MLQIDIKGLPTSALPDVKSDPNVGMYFELGDSIAEVPPDFSAKQFGTAEIFTFFVTNATAIGVSVLARFLYDLLKKDKATSITINNYIIKGDSQVEIENVIIGEQDRGSERRSDRS